MKKNCNVKVLNKLQHKFYSEEI